MTSVVEIGIVVVKKKTAKYGQYIFVSLLLSPFEREYNTSI